MRKAINENKTVQLVLLGVLFVLVALLFTTRVMKKEDTTGPASGAEAAAQAAGGTGVTAPGAPPVTGDSSLGGGTAAAAPSTSATGTAVPGVAAPSTGTAVPSTTASASTVSPEALVPGPGLPAPVKAAWDRGDAIVLLIVRGAGTDDKLVRASVSALSNPGVKVFVSNASQIARYSRITQGVGVSEVPALVVIRPRRLSGAVPQAVVSYGFRDSQSVVQAVHDALYTGRDDLPYSPR